MSQDGGLTWNQRPGRMQMLSGVPDEIKGSEQPVLAITRITLVQWLYIFACIPLQVELRQDILNQITSI